MEIKTVGRQIDITPAIREHAESKASKLPRYFDRITEIEVLIKQPENRTFQVELLVAAEHTDGFAAKASGDDLYLSIDQAVLKMERQLTDHKERLRNRKHNVS